MEPKYRFRLYLLTALVLAGCGTLLSRLYEFQIDRRAQFVANIPTTHTVTVIEPGVRGEITDRNGVTLARNSRRYEIVFNLEDIYKSYRQQNSKAPVPAELGEEGTNKEAEIERIVRTWVVPRLESFGLTGERFTNAIDSHYRTHGGLVPYVYRSGIPSSEFAQIAVRSNELPGVEVRVVPHRTYPYGSLACHLLGRVNGWSKGNVPPEFDKKNVHYQGDDKGITGVERTMDQFLRGEGGKRVLVRNEKRKVIATDDYQPAREGAQVQLTIDARLQHIVENVLRRIGRGAAVVMDPNTGEVLAMASVPNFDPNDFIGGIEQKKFDAYNKNKAHPFVNRALSPYMPGSTFKLPTAIAGALHHKTGYHHNCRGFTLFGRDGSLKIRCHRTAGHGTLGLSEAIQRSCNPYFMTLAGNLRSKVMVDTFHLLGFGKKTGILLPEDQAGIVPGSNFWKREVKPGAIMTDATLALMSIGQGDAQGTPLQICSMTATIANGGKYYQPRIVRRVLGRDLSGKQVVLKENIPLVKADLIREGMTKGQMEVIRKGMWKAVNERGGTATAIAMKDVFIAAKTGTTQLSKTDMENTHNAWTTSFAPYDSARYAVCVMVRNGQSGGSVAGVLSHLIYRGIFALEAGLDTRLTKMGVYAGNFDSFKELELPEGGLFTLTTDEEGETGNEVDPSLIEAGQPIKVSPNTVPLPTIAPTPDSEQSE